MRRLLTTVLPCRLSTFPTCLIAVEEVAHVIGNGKCEYISAPE